jgi:hypothetical protein
MGVVISEESGQLRPIGNFIGASVPLQKIYMSQIHADCTNLSKAHRK